MSRAYDIAKLLEVAAELVDHLNIDAINMSGLGRMLVRKLTRAMQDTQDELSHLERDGVPTLYLSETGSCTHRMASSDIRVWCATSEDAMRLMTLLDWIRAGKPTEKPVQVQSQFAVGLTKFERSFEQFLSENGYVKAKSYENQAFGVDKAKAYQVFFSAASADGGYNPQLGIDAVIGYVTEASQ